MAGTPLQAAGKEGQGADLAVEEEGVLVRFSPEV